MITELSRLIEWLTDLPPEAPELTKVVNFLETATAIASEKLRQQREAGTQQLRKEIELLRANYSAELQDLDMECGHWDAKTCMASQAATIAPQVAQFRLTLTTYLQLDQDVLPASLPERRARRNKLTDMEVDIKRLYGDLNLIFSQSSHI